MSVAPIPGQARRMFLSSKAPHKHFTNTSIYRSIEKDTHHYIRNASKPSGLVLTRLLSFPLAIPLLFPPCYTLDLPTAHHSFLNLFTSYFRSLSLLFSLFKYSSHRWHRSKYTYSVSIHIIYKLTLTSVHQYFFLRGLHFPKNQKKIIIPNFQRRLSQVSKLSTC
ncbi:LAFA_0D12002g1_1 [Lachancea sp. 'fantastica']|nr:LAFA_0D12002g1_1 [Lachancea sp. 'fantastica']